MKHLLSITSIIFLVFISGCAGYVANTEKGDVMVAKKGDHVAVHYTGTLEDRSVFDSSEGREPLEFDVGAGQMIKGFDSAVVGMKVGEEKSIKIKPEDAYGQREEKNIIVVPKNQVPSGVKNGDTLNAQGQPVKVVSVGNETVKIDFNHPLAGETLNFKINIVKIE
jgi:peptidylprolyl isomerase